MNKIIFFYLILLATCHAQAKVITVDNNGGAGADFTSISAAISSASSGDSIYVHPSYTSYGDININKHIYLIGPGHYPESSGFLSASIHQITLNNGSSGTVISGFKITYSILASVFHQVSNITIENNYYISGGIFVGGPFGDGSNGDNWTIRGNVIFEQAGCGGCKVIDIRSSQFLNDNWLIANNIIISKNSENSTQIFSDLNANTTVINNTIFHNNTQFIFEDGSNSNALIKNNIIVSVDASLTNLTSGCTNCTWENNLTYNPNATLDPLPGTGNVDNQDPDFVQVASFAAWSYDNDYNVNESSPAHNTGSDGTDMGAYGANFNFNKFGYPFGVPIMDQLFIENQLVSPGEPLRFSIKARSAESQTAN